MAYNRKDAVYDRAKAAGYRSRAAYKLRELAERYGLIRRGDRVLDLGAWPGGWMQVAAELCGPRGRVVGVDLQAIEPIPLANVAFVQGDVEDAAVRRRLGDLAQGRLDVVLSDMSPKLTGVRARDEAHAVELAHTALALVDEMLAPHGRLLMKVFMNEESKEILQRARSRFRTVKLTRPDATRKGSTEIYLVALDHRPSGSTSATS